jgi:hypothetical protein
MEHNPLAGYCWLHINWELLGKWSMNILGFAFGLAIGWFLIRGLKKLFSLISFGSIRKPSWFCTIHQRVFKPLGKKMECGVIVCMTWLDNYVPKFVLGAVSFFSFFWGIFKAWKSKNCPAIIWKE